MKTVNVFLITILLWGSYLFLPKLPDQIPMHWNIRGEIDSYWPKIPAVWFMPALTLVIFILFQVLPSIDPNKNKYKLFQKEWQIIQTGFITFFFYLQFIIFYISLNPDKQMLPLMLIGLGSLFILLGNYLSKIRQNYFVGIKVPWTLANEDNWNKTHRFASWCYVIVGITTVSESFFLWQTPVVIFGGMGVATVLPIIYSYLLFKKSQDKMKYVLWGLLLFILMILFVRGISSEDDWICNDGKWIMHGHPVSPRPQSECLKNY